MRFSFKNIVFLLIALLPYGIFSQNKDIEGYSIDGDTIIFTFNRNDYTLASFDKSDEFLKINSLSIENVSVAGNFNNWSRRKWNMRRINDSIYQLKKKISDFDDDFNWEFKFVINNSFWAEPQKHKASNLSSVQTDFNKDLRTYNYTVIPDLISEKGNTKFKLKGFKDAKQVILSGTFNRWSSSAYNMIKGDGGWELTLELSPGSYAYRFKVDDVWLTDPENQNKEINQYGEYNSLINVTKEVCFVLEDYDSAKKVVLSGSFNNWSESDCIMKRIDDKWIYTTHLTGGKHHYKFIVDGKWLLDPKNTVKEYDYDGNINSVIMVK